jgi:hypothetical protein
MLIAQSNIKPLHSFFPHTCWVRQVLTLAINNVAQKEEATMKSCEDVAGARRTQPPVDYLWCLEPSFSRIKRKSLVIFLFLTWYCFCIHLYVTICMKLDPGMHIGLHLIFFGKTGVTTKLRKGLPKRFLWRKEMLVNKCLLDLFTKIPEFNSWKATKMWRCSKVPSSKVHRKEECSRIERLPVKLSWPSFTWIIGFLSRLRLATPGC